MTTGSLTTAWLHDHSCSQASDPVFRLLNSEAWHPQWQWLKCGLTWNEATSYKLSDCSMAGWRKLWLATATASKGESLAGGWRNPAARRSGWPARRKAAGGIVNIRNRKWSYLYWHLYQSVNSAGVSRMHPGGVAAAHQLAGCGRRNQWRWRTVKAAGGAWQHAWLATAMAKKLASYQRERSGLKSAAGENRSGEESISAKASGWKRPAIEMAYNIWRKPWNVW